MARALPLVRAAFELHRSCSGLRGTEQAVAAPESRRAHARGRWWPACLAAPAPAPAAARAGRPAGVPVGPAPVCPGGWEPAGVGAMGVARGGRGGRDQRAEEVITRPGCWRRGPGAGGGMGAGAEPGPALGPVEPKSRGRRLENAGPKLGCSKRLSACPRAPWRRVRALVSGHQPLFICALIHHTSLFGMILL